MDEPDILFDVLACRQSHEEIGLITLNRPKMLNALNEFMILALYEKLLDWESSSTIKIIVIRGAGDRAFCAGGDIRSVYERRSEASSLPEKPFFWYEYRLNQLIQRFKKPYIALLDGLTMGGGVGLSINSAFRVASEKLKLAMPETSIGFFPDVGGSYFLPRCVGYTGWYLGLTATSIDANTAYYTGLVNYLIKSEDLPTLLKTLINTAWSTSPFATVRQILNTFVAPVPSCSLLEQRSTIDDCFSQSSIELAIQQLQSHTTNWAQETAQLLLTRSPTSLKVTFAQLTHGKTLSFDDCMRMEYRLALRFLQTPDFYEGIRAAIIDKDRNPHWNPATLALVPTQQVASYFSAFTDREELNFDCNE